MWLQVLSKHHLRSSVYSLWLLVWLLPLKLRAGGSPVTLRNPLAFDTIQAFLEAVLRVVIVLSIPVIVFFIIYAGFLYVTARGNVQQVQDATRALTYAIIGGIIVIGAIAIANVIGNVVSEFERD